MKTKCFGHSCQLGAVCENGVPPFSRIAVERNVQRNEYSTSSPVAVDVCIVDRSFIYSTTLRVSTLCWYFEYVLYTDYVLRNGTNCVRVLGVSCDLLLEVESLHSGCSLLVHCTLYRYE